ncbi:MAG: Spy/CpxP family protein refolding chaperone [Gemmatimonadota bacterium]
MTGRMMVLAAGFALLGVPQAIAQDESTGEREMRHRAPRAEMRHRAPGPRFDFDRSIGRLMDRQHELNLSEDQMTTLDALRSDARATLAPVREAMDSIHDEMRDGSLTREDAGERMKGIREQAKVSMKELHDRLEETLDPEQLQALRHGRGAHGARRSAHGGRSGSHARPGRHGGRPHPESVGS